MAYQSYAKGGSFAPRETTTYLPALEENQQRIRQAENVYFDQMRQNDRTKVKNAEQAGEGLKALGKFSTKLSEVMLKQEERQREEDMNEGVAMAYEDALYGPGTPERLALDSGEAQLKADDAEIQGYAGVVLGNNPENYQAATKIKSLSGWKQYGYAMGIAQTAGQGYSSWMESAMQTDSTTQINVGGESFTPAQAKDPAQVQAAMAVLRRQYLKQAGISNLSKPLLAKYAFEQMYKADAKIVGQARKDYAISQSIVDAGEADNALFANKDLGTYLDSLSTTVDNNGNMRGYAGAWNEGMSRIEKAVKAGLLTEADLTQMEGQIQGTTGKTFGELHAIKFADLRIKIQDQEKSDYERDKGFREFERTKAEDEIINELMSLEDITEADIEAAEAKLDEIYPGVDSTKLNNIKSNMSVEATAMKAQEDEIKQLAEAGLLTPERLSKFHYTLQQRYSNIANMQKEAAPDLKPYEDSVVSQVEKAVNFDRNTANDGTVDIMKAKAKADFRQLTQKFMQAGKPAEEAGGLAAAEIFRRLEAAKTDPGSQYHVNEKGYPNVLPSRTDAQNATQSAREEIRRVEATVNALGGKRAFGTQKDLVFNEEELQQFEQQLNNGTFVTPPEAAYFAQTYGFNDPLELINAQREAAGMEPMNVPASVEAVRQGVNPEFQKFLYNFPTEKRQARGLSTAKNFEPAVVPKGYGEAIQNSATKYDISPSILAGLIETESAWDPNAVSPAGAIGLAQFKSGAAGDMGLTDRRDPIASIDAAAKYLNYLREYFGGDMEKAIYAYNGGMGNIEQYGVGFDGPGGENHEYYGKVMRNAAKYGYGKLPVRQAKSPTGAIYVTGNIGPTSTGPHLDVKKVGGGYFPTSALDKYVVADDPELGKVPLGQLPITGDFASHTVRGSHGIDYGTYSGTKLYLRNGAKLVGSRPSVHGDVVTIALPNGEQYTFLHGTKG